MKEFEEIRCPVCSSKEYKTICKKGLHNLPLNISICQKCGFIYLNPRWNKKRYEQFYKKEYDKHYRNRRMTKKQIQDKKRNASIIIERVNKYLKKAKTILDIGAGEGNYLMFLKEHFKEVELFAIEPSENSQKILGKNNVTIVSSDVEDEWETNKKFDFIVMNHTLEHLINPKKALKKVRSHLTTKGILYVAVPNTDYPELPLTNLFFRNVHTFYFTKKSLSNLLKISGYNIKIISNKHKNKPYEIYAVCNISESKQIKIEFENSKKIKEKLVKIIKNEEKLSFRLRKYVQKSVKRLAPIMDFLGLTNLGNKIYRKFIR